MVAVRVDDATTPRVVAAASGGKEVRVAVSDAAGQLASFFVFFLAPFAPAVLGSRVGATVRAHSPAALGARRATPPAAAPGHPPRRTTAPAAHAAFARVRAVPPMTQGNATAR